MSTRPPGAVRTLPVLLAAALAAVTACAAGPGPADAKAPQPAAVGAANASATAAAPLRSDDWPTYHGDNYRSGSNAHVMPVTAKFRQFINLRLDGPVYGSPIIANQSTIVATENNTVYRLYGNRVLWSRHLGVPVPRSALPCGNIDPNGITGTPAYDYLTNTVVVVGLVNTPIRHVAFGLDPLSGALRWSRTVDVPNTAGIDPKAMQQRGALIVYGHYVYIAYGGLAGDCSAYRGSVVGVDLQSPTTSALWHYTVPTSREAGIWAAGGPTAAQPGGLFVAVGNGATADSGAYDYSDSILRLYNQQRVDSFSPAVWRTDNRNDLDLGSQSPAPIGRWVFAAGKNGNAYVLDAARLGGIGGQVWQGPLCRSFGGTAAEAPNFVYVPCTDGVRKVRINSNGSLDVMWRASANVNGSPVLGGGRVWALDPSAGVLHALDPATGADRGQWATGAVTRFATPALWHSAIYVPTTTGAVAYRWD